MHPVFQKTFGGLSKAYYFRQLVFGLLLFGVFYIMPIVSGKFFQTLHILPFFLISAFLYPYSRFVYESVVSFFVGDNTFILPIPVMLGYKLVTMGLCYALAIFIAPVGLAYLYWHHSRQVTE